MCVIPTVHWLAHVDWANPALTEAPEIRDGHAHPREVQGSGI